MYMWTYKSNLLSLATMVISNVFLWCKQRKYVQPAPIIQVLLEADTEKHKTSMSKEAKTRLLPFFCLGRFLSEKAWGTSFMEARGTFGISKPFLPSWNESSQTFGTHRMTTCEATCWMHELLEPEIGAANALRFFSHSCKATILTWAGMCNLFTREERTLLGHHVEAQTRSSTTYNRDSQVLLQYKVATMINLVKSGKLKPDASRSERLSMMLEEGVTDDDADQRLEPEVDLASSDDESDDVGSPVAELALSGSEKETPSEHDGFSIVGDVEMWIAFTILPEWPITRWMRLTKDWLVAGLSPRTFGQLVAMSSIDLLQCFANNVKRLTRRVLQDCFQMLPHLMNLTDLQVRSHAKNRRGHSVISHSDLTCRYLKLHSKLSHRILLSLNQTAEESVSFSFSLSRSKQPTNLRFHQLKIVSRSCIYGTEDQIFNSPQVQRQQQPFEYEMHAFSPSSILT